VPGSLVGVHVVDAAASELGDLVARERGLDRAVALIERAVRA
jgi:hypothetical protein